MVMLKPEKGRLLIAEPSILNDDSFKRSIILITDHSENSSVGFILNRPMDYAINDLVPELDCNFTVYQGGPVEQDNLYFIHQIPHLLNDSIEVAKGIYWGGNFNQLRELINKGKIKNTDIRFFLGYSGWGAFQLEDELNAHTWFITENEYDNIFSIDEETFWKNKLLQRGGKYRIWANAPADIKMN
ncbi:YqgE/AlgH family protein [Tenacibaculum sp. IB213877]|uniref:YqgE/AlgH family protein n=1 Tax=Tenacibaculum sp. IB213877 TaxID=3097351 RepID=UPI002A59FE6E|nr:YqgE/AlgH family protein [Tenacibaculum sp. IB213877]MDY0781484.1 YqgE/AlgH family protein [Tenacibaculum sp. IB213877]